jgi:hypothetical protein
MDPQIPNQQAALKILIQGINLAQSRGAYNLTEAGLLDKCVKLFTRPAQEDAVQPQDTVIRDDDDEQKDIEVENIQI